VIAEPPVDAGADQERTAAVGEGVTVTLKGALGAPVTVAAKTFEKEEDPALVKVATCAL
jgi:hypothetical protein